MVYSPVACKGRYFNGKFLLRVTSQLGAPVACKNVLQSMEIRCQDGLNFPPCANYTV